ncbi:uncharacterized protein BDZ99DRAFT_575935 [Mytilinidion resinicola]|uniref:Nucleoporin Nup159/Nup146 N-terminal domain-containing protein n=1 Tax=Mytilinidion resinicola TaxID=574789 RepID=A0A6A6Y4V6_9PEZI|nr:uncharacterized protein BDZ99DRAFT_575935 [Mytilinidion resinicola]KAF2803881.1 hypothetical protein BDZ99DRAFT_575935 [Mytilinidion resinicola]
MTAQVQLGPELESLDDIETLAFAGLKGDKKLKLLPTPWPENSLPPPTSSLFSIASRTGILAAAGPDVLVIATTKSVRDTLSGNGEDVEGATGVKAFTPQVTIPLPRLSQVAFSSNESFLVVSAEQGGGLAVYEVPKLQQLNPQPAFQIPTNSTSVRALIPNPAPEFEDLFSIVLTDGTLLLAHLREQKLVQGPTGDTVLHRNVSSISWSARGKQLVAGLGDGTAVQIKQDGSIVAQIPRPPEIGADNHVVSIYWLDNDTFFVTHCPTQRLPEEVPEPTHHIMTTDTSRANFTFSKIGEEPCFPVLDGKRGYPYHYFLTRLRRWGQLTDLLILISTDGTDVGTLTNSAKPLAPGAAVNVYTVTRLEDSRRAMVPPEIFSDDAKSGMLSDSSVIGVALDLSATDVVLGPIPKEEEINQSSTPLPAFMLLNHEGILCAWWVVYNDSIKEGTAYPGLIAASGATPATAVTSTPTNPAEETPKPLSQPSGFGTVGGGFAKPATPAFGAGGFGTPSGGAKFGQSAFPSSTPLGIPAALGFGKPSFGSVATPAFGSTATPAFGSTATPAFGSTGGIGNRASPWAAQAATPQKFDAPQGGFASFGGAASGFGKLASNTPSQSPFAAAGNAPISGFGALGQSKPGSLFGQKAEPTSFTGTTKDSFGSTVTIGSSFGGGATPSSWAQTPAQPPSLFGGAQTSSFASTNVSSMGDSDDAQNRERDEATPTPQVPPTQPQGLFAGGGFKLGSSFQGDGSAKDDLPKPRQPSSSSLFGGSFLSGVDSKPKEPATPVRGEELSPPRSGEASTTPASQPTFQSINEPSLFGGLPSTTPSHTPAKEPPKPAQTPAAPSPPESPGGEDAPLPPDPMTFKPKETNNDDLPPIAGSPPVQVEAPDSSPISSPESSSRGSDGDISVEEQEDTEEEEPASNHRLPAQKPTWSFGQSGLGQSPQIPPQAPTPPVKSGTSSRSRDQSRSPSRSPVRNLFQQSSTPAGNPFATQKSVLFPPTTRPQDSLRSPSPQRSASTSVLGHHQKSSRTASPFAVPAAQPPPQPPAPAPEVSDLFDDEDDRIRQELKSELVPNRRLDPFVAHQNYTGGSETKTGVPAQIETVYRDINSMIDTLGLNARSLASFVKYHDESSRGDEITREDLDKALDEGEDGDWDSAWCLAEIDQLKVLEDEMGKQLKEGRLTQVHDKLLQLAGLSQDVHKLRARVADVKLQIQARNDPASLERLRLQPLSADVAKMQQELRDSFAALLKRLATAEEEVVLLRAKIAGAGKGGRGARMQVPTVEAVTRTIEKMTAMVSKKSIDIDVLENAVRKLNIKERVGTAGHRASTRGREREGSPFATPPRGSNGVVALRGSLRENTTTGRYGLFDTPDSTPQKNGNGGGEGVSREAVRVFAEKKATRRKLGEFLARAVGERGTKVTHVGA